MFTLWEQKHTLSGFLMAIYLPCIAIATLSLHVYYKNHFILPYIYHDINGRTGKSDKTTFTTMASPNSVGKPLIQNRAQLLNAC